MTVGNTLKKVGGKPGRVIFYRLRPIYSRSDDIPPQVYQFGTEQIPSRQFFIHIPYRLFLTHFDLSLSYNDIVPVVILN
jgi:hypothetical protein